MTVKQIQCLLTYLGYSPGTIDGIEGRNTQEAIRAFQADYGLTVDGIRYFTREEFRCQCGGKYCNGFPAEPAEETVRMADEIRRRAGVPLNVNSGVRCKRHNAEVGGVSNSLHTTGQAVDLSGAISPEKLYAIAQEVQAEKIPGRGGLGLYGWGIHEDNGKYSRWSG